jgi:hypothetical protein
MKFLIFLCFSIALFSEINLRDFEELEEIANFKDGLSDRDTDLLRRVKSAYLQSVDKIFDTQNTKNIIPHVVHVIWLGPRSFPMGSIENMRHWQILHPDWKFKFWSDRERIPPTEGMEIHYFDEFPLTRLRSCYEASENWGEKSDILRYEILNAEGGIYIDHDADCLKSFDAITKNFGFFVGLEPPHASIDNRGITLGIGIIGSRKGHPYVKEAIDYIDHNFRKVEESFESDQPLSRGGLVLHRTYIALSHVIFGKEAYEDDLLLLPAKYFYPSPKQNGILSKHYYGSTWFRNDTWEWQLGEELGLMKLKLRHFINFFIFSGLLTLFIIFIIYLTIGKNRNEKKLSL